VWVSLASLRAPGSHGFYRFFAWELVLVLILLDARRWFHEPLEPLQLVSWALLTVSLVLAVQGIRLLRRGKPDAARDDAPMIGLEKTTALVTEGVYRHIRHPLYSSLLFLTWGTFCKGPTWPAALLALAATACLVLTARAEERENVRYFGRAYQDYMAHTKRFLPFVV
jgi:protein-S-isoprenylcysteine O-methyltransferase Ste14